MGEPARTGFQVAYDGKRGRWVVIRTTTEVVGEFAFPSDADRLAADLRRVESRRERAILAALRPPEASR